MGVCELVCVGRGIGVYVARRIRRKHLRVVCMRVYDGDGVSSMRNWESERGRDYFFGLSETLSLSHLMRHTCTSI